MIFVSVGSRYPFDRLIQAVDAWAGQNPNFEIYIQRGDSVFNPAHCESVSFLSASEFKSAVSKSDLVISHAGMGNIITALEFAKPIVVVPRLPEFGEVVNNHQISTIRSLEGKGGVLVLEDLANLPEFILKGLSYNSEQIDELQGPSPKLIDGIRSFINS